MTRRVVRGRSRVLLSDSSDEEDDNIEVVVKHVVAEGNVAPPGIDSMLLEDEIEDDDISDEPPAVTIFPLAERVRSFPQENNMNNNFQGGGSPLHQLLRRRGINVLPECLDSFVRGMEGFSTFGVEKQGELVLANLLITDFNEVGAGCLPNSFETLHATELAGPFVLQVTIPFPLIATLVTLEVIYSCASELEYL